MSDIVSTSLPIGMTISISSQLFQALTLLGIGTVSGYLYTLKEWIEFFSQKENKGQQKNQGLPLILKTSIYSLTSMFLVSLGELNADRVYRLRIFLTKSVGEMICIP